MTKVGNYTYSHKQNGNKPGDGKMKGKAGGKMSGKMGGK